MSAGTRKCACARACVCSFTRAHARVQGLPNGQPSFTVSRPVSNAIVQRDSRTAPRGPAIDPQRSRFRRRRETPTGRAAVLQGQLRSFSPGYLEQRRQCPLWKWTQPTDNNLGRPKTDEDIWERPAFPRPNARTCRNAYVFQFTSVYKFFVRINVSAFRYKMGQEGGNYSGEGAGRKPVSR